MPHTTDCFVGEESFLNARGKPGGWITRRLACDQHLPLATLPNGENLLAFLERRADPSAPPRGSGLNFLINPVGILSHRAWCDFRSEHLEVQEEVFHSKTYFDFYVQHTRDIQSFFYAFYQTFQKHKNSGSFFETILALRRENPTTEKHLNDLINLWTLQLALEQELRARRLEWPESPDQAQEIFYTVYERINEETVLSNVVNDMLKRLVELGSQRFRLS